MEHCLDSAEFLVCQDIFPNETTRFAHVVFPAAAWSENEGTFTNCERRVSRVRKVTEPPGLAQTELVDLPGTGPEDGPGMALPKRPRDLGPGNFPPGPAIGRRSICPAGRRRTAVAVPDLSHPGTPTLHKDGCFTCGLGQFQPIDWTPPAEVPDREYPFVLSTGRRLYHYHTRTQTGRAAGLE